MKIGDLLITIQVNTRECTRATDQLRRALSRLRYPPKKAAKGGVSRRREKIRKAGVLR